MIEAIPQVISDIIGALGGLISEAFTLGQRIASKLFDGLMSDGVLSKIGDIAMSITGNGSMWQELKQKYNSQRFWGDLYQSIDRMAEGRVVTKPTITWVGEKGAEAVIPLENNTGWIDQVAHKLNDAMNAQAMVFPAAGSPAYAAADGRHPGTGYTFNINISDVQMNSDKDIQDVARELSDYIVADIVRVGGAF